MIQNNCHFNTVIAPVRCQWRLLLHISVRPRRIVRKQIDMMIYLYSISPGKYFFSFKYDGKKNKLFPFVFHTPEQMLRAEIKFDCILVIRTRFRKYLYKKKLSGSAVSRNTFF